MDKTKRKMYTCLHCQKNGVAYVQERYRAVTHVQKHHMALDQAPFYCSLCMFRCSTRDALEKHVVHYKRHDAVAATLGYDPNPRRHLIQNPNPKQVVDGVDIRLATNLDLACRNPYRLDDTSDDFDDAFPLPLSSQTPPAEPLPVSPRLINISVTPEQLAKLMSPAAPGVNHIPQQQYDPFRPSITAGSTAPRLPLTLSTDLPEEDDLPVFPEYTPSVPANSGAFQPTTTATAARVNVNATIGSAVGFQPLSSVPFTSGKEPELRLSSLPGSPLKETRGTLGSILNTPPLARRSPSAQSVLEDITADLLPKDQCFDLPSTPAQTGTRRTGQAIDNAPHEVKVPSVELGPVVEAIGKLEKSITSGFSSLVTMMESNARAIRNLEKTLCSHLLQMSKSLDRLSERNGRSRRDDDLDRRPEKRPRIEEHEKENRPSVKSTVNKPNRK